MPFDKAIPPSTPQGVFPGVAPIKSPTTTAFGQVVPAKVSPPKRLLEVLSQKVHQLLHPSRPQPVPTTPPLPTKGGAWTALGKAVTQSANGVAQTQPGSAERKLAEEHFGGKIEHLLEHIAEGKLTTELPASVRQALGSSDSSQLTAALHTALLELLPQNQRISVDLQLSRLLQGAVDRYLQDHGALTQAPLADPLQPPALRDPQGQPLVRLQTLGIGAEAMKPMLETLYKISGAAQIGDTGQASELLDRFVSQLRPHLEKLDGPTQKTFAMSQGGAFIDDLKNAILGQAAPDERELVKLELDHWMGGALAEGFQKLVKDLPGAVGVTTVNVQMPPQANVGVHNLGALAQALQRDPADEGEIRRSFENFMQTVRHGDAGPALTTPMKEALARNDFGGFVVGLLQALRTQVPADRREALALGSMRLGPLLAEEVDRHGDIKLPAPSPTVSLQAKTHFETPLLPAARLADLKGTPKQAQKLNAALQRTAHAMAQGDIPGVRTQLDRLAQELRPVLMKLPESQRLAWALSDGEAFMTDLARALLEQVPPEQRAAMADQLNLFMRPHLEACFDTLVTHVLDKPLVPDSDPSLPPKSIQVQGRTYERVGDEPLGSGNFGAVWAYQDPRNPTDRVVMKVPKPGSDTMLDDLNEGRSVVQAMGTGGGSQNNVTLSGVIRNGDSVNLVFRLQPGGSLQKALGHLMQGPITPDVAMGKVGLMSDLVGALRRLHEAKNVNHLDIALRNVLLDAQGRAILADHGLSIIGVDGHPIDGAKASFPDKNLPVRWASPETLKDGTVTEKSEVFSLGVAFAELVWGLESAPWGYLRNLDIATMRMDGSWDAKEMVKALGEVSATAWPDPQMRTELADLVTRMLDVDPDRRPSLAELQQHPLLQKVQDHHREALATHLQGKVAPEPKAQSVTQQVVTQQVVTQQVVTQPVVTQPVVTQPVVQTVVPQATPVEEIYGNEDTGSDNSTQTGEQGSGLYVKTGNLRD